MKVANFADLHARGKDLDAFRSQWFGALRLAVDYYDAELITIAGDIFDSPNIGDRYASTGAIIEAVANPILFFSYHRHAEFIIIPGNHDAKSGDVYDALSSIGYIPNVTVARNPGFRVTGHNVDLFVSPYTWNDQGASPMPTVRDVEMRASTFPSLFLGHFPIAGAIMGATTAEHGLSRAELAKLPFSRFALGDFHKRQDLFDGRGGYVGALRQLNFGEGNNPQGFEVWDTEENTVEWVEVNEAPRYVTIKLTEPAIDLKYLTTLAEFDHVRLICDGFMPSKEEDTALESAGVQVECIIDRQERETRVDQMSEGILKDDSELIRTWGRAQSPALPEAEINDLIDTHKRTSHVRATAGEQPTASHHASGN